MSSCDRQTAMIGEEFDDTWVQDTDGSLGYRYRLHSWYFSKHCTGYRGG